MKKVISIIICTCISCYSFSQTSVSGLINSNTNWTTASSPYIVDGNLLVEAGITLTVDPGVIVKFDSGKTMQIDGDMIAIGSELNPIQFTANTSSPTAGYWNHIHFTSQSTPATFDLGGNYQNGSILKYCDISYGGGIDNGNLYIDNAGPFISNCTIEYGSSHGIFLQKSMSRIDSCHINNNLKAGIFSSHSGVYHDFNIQNNEISSNDGGGIYIDEMWQNSIEISSNDIKNNSFSGIYINSSGGSGSGTVTIESNLIYNNTANQGGGIYVKGGFDLYINCNTIQNNQSTTGSAFYDYRGSNLYNITFNNNKISNNVSSSGDVIYLFYSTSYAMSFDIADNWIFNNSAINGSVFNITGGITIDLFNIHNNSIIDNNGDNTFELYDFNGHINVNNLSNSTTYEIGNNNDAGTLTIDAKNNYWFTTTQTNIDTKIYDWFDNAALSVVELSPIGSNDFTSDTSCSPPIFSSIDFEDEISDKQNILVYPNPFEDGFTIDLVSDGLVGDYSLIIYGVDGKEVLRVDKLSNQPYIDMSYLNSGVYMYKLLLQNLVVQSGKLIAK
jgi:hypothetical protein